jgi:hypothetical protein
MLNIFVPKVCLQCPSVVASVGEGVPIGMPEHVRVRLEAQLRLDSRAFDHPGKAGGSELVMFEHDRCSEHPGS